MDTINFFVNKTDEVVVECPQCNNSKTISIGAYKGKKYTMKVKCPCGHTFAINLDSRENYRKKTFLEGSYQVINLNIDSYYEKLVGKTIDPLQKKREVIKNCTVKDLSVSGVGLNMWERHTIEEGDELFLEFNLDNTKQTPIRCIVIVRTVRNNLIGAEYKDKKEIRPYLGFYFM